jgi:YHS domain-containing protein
MTFIARLLRFLFWVALVSWSVSLLRRLVGAMGAGGAAQNQDSDSPESRSQTLVRDPVCGMHIAPGLALSVNDGGEMVHFCSPECRDKYLGGRNKFVANA